MEMFAYLDLLYSPNYSVTHLAWEELAGRDLFEGGGGEHVIDPGHYVVHRLAVSDIADIELDLMRHLRAVSLEEVAHVILLFLIAGEDADFLCKRPLLQPIDFQWVVL